MTTALDLIQSALQNYVVAPLNAFGLGGFIFDAEGEGVAILSSDITDHYTEDNRALQDHIAIRPEKVILRGYVGELVYRTDDRTGGFVQKVTQKLTQISAFLPTLSAAAQQAQQVISSGSITSINLTDAANIYSNIKNSLTAIGGNNLQKNAYEYFKALQQQGILMAIQTPWEFMTNMAIETVMAVQPEESKYITDFSVTFKKIRIAEAKTVAYATSGVGGIAPPGNQTLSPIAALQGSPSTNLGQIPGVGLPYAGLPGAQGRLTGATDLANPNLVGNWVYS